MTEEKIPRPIPPEQSGLIPQMQPPTKILTIKVTEQNQRVLLDIIANRLPVTMKDFQEIQSLYNNVATPINVEEQG